MTFIVAPVAGEEEEPPLLVVSMQCPREPETPPKEAILVLLSLFSDTPAISC